MECLQREYQVKSIALPDTDDYNFSFNNIPEQVIGRYSINLDSIFNSFKFVKISQVVEAGKKKDNRKFRAVLPALQMAGHTGYLTFATWPRRIAKCLPVH